MGIPAGCLLLSPDGQNIQSLLQKLRGYPTSIEDLEVRYSRNHTRNKVVEVSKVMLDRIGPLSAWVDDKLFLGKEGREQAEEKEGGDLTRSEHLQASSF